MKSENFGEILKSLREQSYLPGNNKPMTQNKLASNSVFSARVIGNIESGIKKNLQYADMEAIAKALRLTNLERKELHYAVSQINEHDHPTIDQYEANEILSEIDKLVESVQMPAYVLDVYGNIVAANQLIISLYNLAEELKIASESNSIIRYHYLSLFLSSAFIEDFETDESFKLIKPDHKILTNMQFFNRISLRYRYKEQYKAIFNALLQEKELFFYYWDICCKQKLDVDANYTFYSYNNPEYGQLRYYAFDVPVITNYEELYIIIYVPANINSTIAFTEIAKLGNKVKRFSKWPMPKPE